MLIALLFGTYTLPNEWQKIPAKRPNGKQYKNNFKPSSRKQNFNFTRKRIIEAMKKGDKFVHQLEKHLSLSHATVHRHMHEMIEDEIVYRVALGANRFEYFLA